VIAYAPLRPRAAVPWLIEVDLATGRAEAFYPRADDGPLHTRREYAERRVYASLADGCRAAGLDPADYLELRWWDEVDLAAVARVELARLGRHDLVVRREGARVVIARGVVARPVADPHDLWRVVSTLAWRRVALAR
jgi:hypothetical protein